MELNMGIFAAAALAGFLLFGWITASPRVRGFFLNRWVQGCLGLLVLVVLVFSVIVQIFQWAECWIYLCEDFLYWVLPYWVFLIGQRLTGPEVVQLILGVAFGCVLRYWGPQFWEMRMRPGTRYNWVAISLVGLLLLVAAVPYIERQLGEMTGLKTPFAEFQFVGTTNVERATFEIERDVTNLGLLPGFASTGLKTDLSYLALFQGAANTNNHSVKKEPWEETEKFIGKILTPLADCAFRAYENGLDPESIRHALSPVAQELRLLIQSGQPENSTRAKKLLSNLQPAIKKSVNRLKEAIVQDRDLLWNELKESSDLLEKEVWEKDWPLKEVQKLKEDLDFHFNLLASEKDVEEKDPPLEKVQELEKSLKHLKDVLVQDNSLLLKKLEKSLDLLKNMCPLGNLESFTKPETLAKTPHIYFALARLDTFNDNQEIAISILKRASKQFGYDRNLILGITFHINYILARYLYESEHAPEDIFLYLDMALEIAQDTRRRIEKWEDSSSYPDNDKLQAAKESFKAYERNAQNALAYFSAKIGVRKFEALRYAEENYNDREKLLHPLMKSEIIDTYGYVKMAFAARKAPPDFDEIEQAKALFQQALYSLEIATDMESSRNAIAYKHSTKKTFRSHLEKAKRLLASR